MGIMQSIFQPLKSIDRKVYEQDKIVAISDPDYVVIPLEYPDRILYQPIVKIGDMVGKNQIIGKSKFGHCIHAPFSGEIKDILLIWTTHIYHVPALLIEKNDNPPCSVEDIFDQFGVPFETASTREKLKAMGVPSPWTRPGRYYQEGEEGFPDIEKIVIHAADEEPTIYVNDFIIKNYCEELNKGIAYIRNLSPRAEVHLTVSDYLAEWARKQFDSSVFVYGLKKEYRERLELLVVPEVTKTKIHFTEAYRSKGVARISAEFLLHMVYALNDNKPFISKMVTVAGKDLENPVTVEVPIGTTIRHIFDQLNINSDDGDRIIAGGPMMGITQYTDLTPVTKKDPGLYVKPEENLSEEFNLTCTNCGKCTQVCPVNLQVQLIGRCAEFEMLPDAQNYHPELCIECGLCAFVCPAHRPLLQLIQLCKKYHGKEYESNQQQIECSPQSSLEKWDNDFRNAKVMADSPGAGISS